MDFKVIVNVNERQQAPQVIWGSSYGEVLLIGTQCVHLCINNFIDETQNDVSFYSAPTLTNILIKMYWAEYTFTFRAS